MNILTFDIEEWYLDKRKYITIKLDTRLDNVLEDLDKRKFKATFFCLGIVAREYSYVIKKINDRGHEIGCQSDKHDWLYLFNNKELLEDTHKAIDSIEQLIGKKVKSYRAPAFSIGEKNKWAFEVLAQCGIERDASVFPAVRDFGGFPSFESKTPVTISYNGITIKEFPIPIIKLLGKEVAYSGGGYFRFFPLSFIQKKMNQSDYSMTYFHIGDLLPETSGVLSRAEYETYFKEKGTFANRYKRYIKTNLGTKGACNKLMQLLQTNDFINLEQADKLIDWKNTNKEKL